jgi:hypothetical protein
MFGLVAMVKQDLALAELLAGCIRREKVDCFIRQTGKVLAVGNLLPDIVSRHSGLIRHDAADADKRQLDS